MSQLPNPKHPLPFSRVFNSDAVPSVSLPVFSHLPGCCQTAQTDTSLHTGLIISQISCLRFLWSWQTEEKAFLFFVLKVSFLQGQAGCVQAPPYPPIPVCSPDTVVSAPPRYKTVHIWLLGDLNCPYSRCECVRGWCDGLVTCVECVPACRPVTPSSMAGWLAGWLSVIMLLSSHSFPDD